jgi:hypothetical protein
MRVNIISNNRNQTGLSQDVDLLHGIWCVLFPDAQVRRFHHAQPECDEGDVNIFMEILNPSLFVYAGINIWIPNPEWTYTSWTPYFSQLDHIWCKTEHSAALFAQHNKSVRYIGWTSISKNESPKNYQKAIVVAGKNTFRHPQIVIDSYRLTSDTSLLPELNVVYDSTRMNVVVPPGLENKIVLHPNTLHQKEYDALLAECGLAICISAGEGFGHAVNEAASTGCICMLNDIPPFVELGYESVWIPRNKVIPSDRIDTLYSTRVVDVFGGFDRYLGLSDEEKKRMSAQNAEMYRSKHLAWVESMRTTITGLDIGEYSLEASSTPESELPGVTIVTPTRDRVAFMELCAGCVDSQCYPTNKLEWIVLDDGKDTCEDKIKHIPFAKHILMMQGKTIAEKRNMGAHLAKFPVIVHFDDDDIYPPNSILFRVSMLMRGSKGAVFCSTIPCYDIKNLISFMNVPPQHLAQSERVSEATMAYTKTFWEEKGFPDEVKIAEGDAFIRGREHMCREISPQEVIVSLVHPRTTSSRKAPKGMEPNGCHFGFTDDLYKMLGRIAEQLA